MNGIMEAKQPDIAERVVDLAMAEPYERALLTLRGYVAALLDTGYQQGRSLRRPGSRAGRAGGTRGSK